MSRTELDDLLTSAEASEMIGRRIEPYHRRGRITPARRVGSGIRSPLLYHRRDVEKLRKEIAAHYAKHLARAGGK